MSQLVFVHGVNTRKTPEYARECSIRDNLLSQVAFARYPLNIHNSYWGGDGSSLAFSQASLPRSGQTVASFSLTGGFAAGSAASGARLAALAQVDFSTAVDALFVSLVEAAEAQGRDLHPDEIEAFREAAIYVEHNPKPYWALPDLSDAQFVAKLQEHLPPASNGPTAFGLGNTLLQAANSLFNGSRNLAGRGLTNLFRDDLNPAVAHFLGDVFVYLKQGDQRERIRKRVIDDLNAAHAARKPGEPLVVIGHSLGGVILYDILSDRPSSLSTDMDIDLLMTVGSQPGLFEELKLFAASDPRIPRPSALKVPRLGQVNAWLNVYDPIDLFGFRAQPMFEGCEDVTFSSATGLIDAHTAYFKRPQFHQRLNRRLRDMGFI